MMERIVAILIQLFWVTAFAFLSLSALGQGCPSVAFGETTWLVVWRGSDANSSNGVYGSRVSQSGDVLDTPAVVVSVGDYQPNPAVAFDGTNWLVVWEKDKGSGKDIYAARVSQLGEVLDAEGIPISTAESYRAHPSVAFGNTSYLVVWTDYRNGSDNRDIYASRITPSGEVLDPEGIPISTAANMQHTPSVAFDGVNWLVVWRDSRDEPVYEGDIYASRVTQSGEVLDQDGFPISTAADSQRDPKLAFGEENHLVVWLGPGGDGARVSPSGVVLDPDGLALLGGAYSVAFGKTDWLAVRFDAQGSYQYSHVKGVLVDQSGAAQLLPDRLGVGYSPASVAFGETRWLITWCIRSYGHPSNILGGRVSQSGEILGDAFEISIFLPPSHTVSTPNTPTGLSSGQVGESLPFSTSGATCSQGHSVQYRFDWADGSYSSWSSSTSASHGYSSIGTYQVRAQARCASNASIVSDWSSAKTISIGQAPPPSHTVSAPSTPTGPSLGEIGESLPFATGGATCSQGHSIQYRFDWGNGNYSNWSSSTSTSYSYSSTGTYQVKAQARCASDTSVVSSWSGAKTASIGTAPPAHTVSTPNTPSGSSTGQEGESLNFSTDGSTCNQGHSVQYQFDWGDGSPYSTWSSSTSASHSYSSTGTYQVRAQARCASDPSVVSNWSGAKTVTIGIAPSPKFLTLPFADSNIRIQQGWKYTAPIGPNPDDPYAHNGIDYIKGEVDEAPWQSFDVVATTDGVAMQSSGGGYGTFVFIRHSETDANGHHYFTLYAHLDNVPSKIPIKSRWDTTFSSWAQVERGEKIGTAGATGVTDSSWVHLHFEVLRGGYAQNKTDPYDIYETRSYYPGGNTYTSCGSRRLWTTDPPSLASPEEKLNCTIEFRKRGTVASIDEIVINEPFDIHVEALIGSPKQVHFSSDEDQDGLATGGWTDWYDWTTSSGDWDEETKTMAWTFTTSGEKEVCAEIKDDTGSAKCFANISAQAPIWRRFIQPGDILYDPCSLHGIGHVGIYIGDGETADPQRDKCRHPITTWDYPARKKVQILRVECPGGYPGCASDAAEWAKSVSDPDRDYSYQTPIFSSKAEKNPDKNETEWYCSELVWAAYFNYGIDIEAFPGNISTNYYNANVPVSPNEICEDGDVYPVGGHTNGVTRLVLKGQCDCSEHRSIRATCPIDLVITDPDGLTISKENNEILDAVYWMDDYDGDGSLDVLVEFKLKKGNYEVQIEPRSEAEPTDTYTLVFENHSTGQEVTLADEALVRDIPDEPYQVEVSDGSSEPPSSSVVLGPNPVPDTGTAFFYSLPESTITAKLILFNISGKPLFETSINPDSTRFPTNGTWNPIDQDGVPLANGPYVYVLIANGKVIGQGKMVVQR